MSRPLEATTIGALVDRAADALGSREAVVFGNQRVSFAAIRDEVDRAARGFIASGIGPGEHVILWVPNRLEWIHAFFGLAKIGAVVVPINTRFRTTDFEYVLRQSDAATLIVVDAFGGVDYTAMVRALIPEIDDSGPLASHRFPKLRRVIMIGESIPPGALAWRDLLRAADRIAPTVLAQRQGDVAPSAPALILYTSGTTGSPKGAMHSHAMVRTVADGANRLGITSRDSILLFLPLFHSMGMYLGGMLFLAAGARLVLMDRFDAGAALALIEKERVGFLLGFDTHCFDLLEHPAFAGTDRSSLRLTMVPAGAAGVEPIARRVNRELSPTTSGYGSSECGTGIALNFLDDSDDARCLGSGFPMPGYEYETRDPETGRPTAAGEAGELYVRGYGVMLGYYGKPKETAEALAPDGWFRTGDLARIDADGFLRYLGRYKDMLKVGGENVDPTEVEAFLEGHPAIAQVKIVGVPDPRRGESPVACVISRPGHSISAEDLARFCAGRIASFKIPSAVVIVDEFPMTTTGKVQRGALRQQMLDRHHSP